MFREVRVFEVREVLRVCNGNDREPDWIQVVVFGCYAQAIAQHLGKGHLVGVTGAIKSRKYTDETTGEIRSYLNVVANSQLSRSSGVRAWRNSASAALYSGVRLAGISTTTVGPATPDGAAMLGPGQRAALTIR